MTEPALRVPLARVALDRDAAARDRPDALAAILADPATRAIGIRGGAARVVQGQDGPGLLLQLPGELDAAMWVYLGRIAGEVPVVAALLDEGHGDDGGDGGTEGDWLGLRAAATVLGESELGLLVEAVALANWHAASTHCPRCGTPTEVQQAGWVRVCPNDRTQVFPRTDPAVIVLVTDADDRVLLGSNALWQNNRYSLLAGFVEPGESFEHAVQRELKEETGLEVVDARYRGSQPWPFPASIMVGFRARLAEHQRSDALAPDGVEILDLRWFTREELLAGTDVVLPGAASIARALLEEWLGAPLPEHGERW